MSKEWRYMELEKIQHLLNEGRVLLGRYIYWTEKRDGSCLAIWMKEEEGIKPHSSGHYYGVRCAVSKPLSLIAGPYKNCTDQERNNVRYCVDDQQ